MSLLLAFPSSAPRVVRAGFQVVDVNGNLQADELGIANVGPLQTISYITSAKTFNVPATTILDAVAAPVDFGPSFTISRTINVQLFAQWYAKNNIFPAADILFTPGYSSTFPIKDTTAGYLRATQQKDYTNGFIHRVDTLFPGVYTPVLWVWTANIPLVNGVTIGSLRLDVTSLGL